MFQKNILQENMLQNNMLQGNILQENISRMVATRGLQTSKTAERFVNSAVVVKTR